MRQRRHVSAGGSGGQISQNLKDLPEEKLEESYPCLSERRVFLLCLAVRVLNSLLVQTYFNPDEHWQALEVAHRIAFGYGHITWEWKKGIRGYLHPMIFALLYKVLAVLGLDKPLIMMRAPRLLQSIFSAVGDLYLYKLSRLLFGNRVAKWALFSELTNWFMFFCITRTLSNSLETVLTIIGLYYWPCVRVSSRRDDSSMRIWGVVVAAFACVIRPTSAIIWMYVGLLELFLARDRMRFIFLEVLPVGVLVLGLATLLDRLVYSSWVLVPLNFLVFNFLSSGGDYYGTHKWHWYFTQGFTVMLFTFLPFSLAGIILSRNWRLSGLIAWVLVLYSVLGHKEFRYRQSLCICLVAALNSSLFSRLILLCNQKCGPRFVLPVLPITLMFSGFSLAAISTNYSSDNKTAEASKHHTKCPSRMRWAICFLLATNIPMALYMSLVHQRGSEDVMNFLSREAAKDRVKSILFLMPCHATPYYSTLHQDLPMDFLDCSPSEERGVPDESDRFMMDPVGFTKELANDWSPPSHIVLFESEERVLREFLLLHSFKEVKRFFHAHFKVDRDLQSSVVVYALTGQ